MNILGKLFFADILFYVTSIFLGPHLFVTESVDCSIICGRTTYYKMYYATVVHTPALNTFNRTSDKRTRTKCSCTTAVLQMYYVKNNIRFFEGFI